MGKLGIIGGMGPLATSIFYGRLINHTKAYKDQDHIDTVISSHASMPDRTTVILNNLDKSHVLDAISQDIKIMEAGSVSRIAIPCNTFHYFYDDVQAMTNIKIINMIEETLKVFKENFGTKACVLCTMGTKRAKVYEKYGQVLGVKIVTLEDSISEKINSIVYDIKSTNQVDRPDFLNLLDKIKSDYDLDGFILSCTELSLIPLGRYQGKNVLDAMEVLVKEAILQTGYNYK